MHIALVAGINPVSPRASGIRSHVVGLATALSRLGHDVNLIGTGEMSTDGSSYRFTSVCPEAEPSTATFWRSLVRRRRTLALGNTVLHAHRPDDLAAFLLRGGIRARILTIHGMSYPGIRARHGWIAGAAFRLLERAGVNSADRVIVLDPATQKDLTRMYPKTADRVTDVPGGVDLDRFRVVSRSAARESLGVADVPSIAFVGRLAPEKNLPLLLDAVAATGVDQLLVAGEGPLRGLIENATPDRVEIRFLGSVEYSRIPLVLNAADVLVLPSHREAMPSVVLESLACGTPVVATRVGGLELLIQDGVNGYLTSPATQPLAEALLKAVEGSSRMRDACRASVEGFGWDRVASRLVRVYEEATR